MRECSALVIIAAALAGCSSATAATPDSNNPAHCMAAFAYAADLSNKGNKADLAARMMSRAEAELHRASGGGRDREEVITESRGFAKAFLAQNRQDLMDQLVMNCLERQLASRGS